MNKINELFPFVPVNEVANSLAGVSLALREFPLPFIIPCT